MQCFLTVGGERFDIIFFATEAGLGTWIGIAAAGFLVFALAPIQRFAERVSDAAMPAVKEPAKMSPDDRLSAYEALARVAWEDGALSADERRLLDEARERLGLSADEASRVESEAAPGGS